MKPTYSIRDWDKDFETAESRKILRTRWVPIPNKHDGKTYSRIARHPRAVEIFCAWNLIVEVASKMPVRGVLVDNDGPLDAVDLSDKTQYPIEIFEIALSVLTESRYNWMAVNYNGILGEEPNPDEAVPRPDQSPLSPGQSPLIRTSSRANTLNPDVVPASAGASGQAGIEGKGREGKGREPGAPDDDLPFHGDDFLREWADYEKHRSQLRKKLTPIARGRVLKQFEAWGEVATTAALRWSISQGWVGVFQPRIPGAGVQAPMFKKEETAEAKVLRENCERCNGTETELVPGKGARPCDHLPMEEIE